MFQRFFGHQQIILVLLWRMAIMYFLFQVTRIGFFVANADTFPEVDFSTLLSFMAAGLIFDTTALMYTNILFIVSQIIPLKIKYRAGYQQAIAILFYLTNALVLTANVADMTYYKFTLRRTTADVFNEFKGETNIVNLLIRFSIDYWQGTLFLILLIAFLIFMYRQVKVAKLSENTSTPAFYILSTLSMALIAVLVLAGIRGDLKPSTRPITLSNAGKYVDLPKQMALVLNTPFTIMRTLGKSGFERLHYYDEPELSQHFSPIHTPPDSIGAFKPMNVVVLILESYAREYVGFYNRNQEGYEGFTPFLDSLIEQGYTWQYSVANGRKSIDAMPSILASIPRTNVPFVLSTYSQNNIQSLVSCLKTKGYTSAFFHGAPNGSMGFDAFTKLAGFEKYYGRDEYPNSDDFDGYWGIWDHKFFPFMVDKLSDLKPPFVSALFSLSSHHPFGVPAEFEGKLRTGPLEVQRCIHYTDHALRLFFEKAKAQPWFTNTLFVITADHSSVPNLPQYKNEFGDYAIPLVFYTPNGTLRGYSQGVAQQADIMPTVLNYLQYDASYLAFGQDLFSNNDSLHYTINYSNEVYQFMSGEYLLLHDGEQTKALYNIVKDPLFTTNLKGEVPDFEERAKPIIRAYMQQYNNRMLDDKLVYEKSTK